MDVDRIRLKLQREGKHTTAARVLELIKKDNCFIEVYRYAYLPGYMDEIEKLDETRTVTDKSADTDKQFGIYQF